MTPDSATADVDTDVAVAALHDVLNEARSAFARAVTAVGVVEWVQNVAGDPIRFRFAGDALLEHLTPALEHHPVVDPSTEAVLTLNVWDMASTGAPVPSLPREPGVPATARTIASQSRCASSWQRRAQFDGLDREAREAWFAVGSPALLTHSERGAPFRLLFHWESALRGRALAHAGAVGTDGTGVLLVGPGGAGKSSTALACAAAGFDYSADDYCLVTSDPDPTALGLYGTGKVMPVDLPLHPTLRDCASSLAHPSDAKVLLVLSRASGVRLAASLRLCAIVIPQLTPTGTRSTASRTSASRALRALAPSTVGQLAGGAASTLHVLADLTRALPCYELELGSERTLVPDVIHGVIEDARPT